MELIVSLKCRGNTIAGNGCKNLGIYESGMDMFCRHHVPKQQDKCVICLGGLYDVRSISCGHTFHKSCIEKWIRKKNNCPICRTLVNELKK